MEGETVKHSGRSILILREKNDTRYVDLSDDDGAVYLALVKERTSEGWYGGVLTSLTRPAPTPPAPYAGDDPDGLYRERDAKRHRGYRNTLTLLRAEQEDARLLQTALGDTLEAAKTAAKKFILSRRDLIHEGAEVVRLEALP